MNFYPRSSFDKVTTTLAASAAGGTLAHLANDVARREVAQLGTAYLTFILGAASILALRALGKYIGPRVAAANQGMDQYQRYMEMREKNAGLIADSHNTGCKSVYNYDIWRTIYTYIDDDLRRMPPEDRKGILDTAYDIRRWGASSAQDSYKGKQYFEEAKRNLDNAEFLLGLNGYKIDSGNDGTGFGALLMLTCAIHPILGTATGLAIGAGAGIMLSKIPTNKPQVFSGQAALSLAIIGALFAGHTAGIHFVNRGVENNKQLALAKQKETSAEEIAKQRKEAQNFDRYYLAIDALLEAVKTIDNERQSKIKLLTERTKELDAITALRADKMTIGQIMDSKKLIEERREKLETDFGNVALAGAADKLGDWGIYIFIADDIYNPDAAQRAAKEVREIINSAIDGAGNHLDGKEKEITELRDAAAAFERAVASHREFYDGPVKKLHDRYDRTLAVLGTLPGPANAPAPTP